MKAGLTQALGQWYVQYNLKGCNYESSDNYKDYTQYLVRGGKGRLISYDTWRNEDLCNTLSSQRIRQKVPGVYTNKDPIGAIWSGTVIVVAIDYKRYKILWGCAKMSVRGDLCDDPFLIIYTRTPKADPKTFATINNALRQIFGFSLGSLPRSYHVMPCPMYAPALIGDRGK
ncbi:uncharacterized protein LOC123554122 [Mercenaria mercenaria]|uniref:uncharacterized protein LOC123554122 n=1 Tax=Mercenaria mercenaria TaxID=6596 RepID=UPI00234F1157|nr:uncharacterized protein LOC123554122 [Mercenaria mercenaria]